MKIPAALTVPLITLSLSIGACGQTIHRIQDTRQAIGSPVRVPTTIPSLEGEPMPTDRIADPILLDDELRAIHDAIPVFNWVLNRDGYAQPDYPTLPRMNLKNITLGQFLQYVQTAYPGVQCVRIDGPAGSLYSVRVTGSAEAGTHSNHVRLYRLSDIIDSQADQAAAKDKDTSKPRDERIKAATADVLSLLQAALDQTDQDGPSSLKIHEPTLTLMFKGSPAKQEVLEEALSTLSPHTPFFNGRPFRTGFSGGSSGPSFTIPPISASADGDYITLSKAIIDQTNAAADQYKQSTDQFKQLEDQRNQLQAQLEQLRAQLAKTQAENQAKSQDNK